MSDDIGDYGEVQAFFEQWQVYRIIIENDYMAHRGIHRSLRASLQAACREPFAILDLGCGDGFHLAATLDGLPVSLYTGVDLSSVALREAEKNLSALSVPLKLVQGELGDYLMDEASPAADVLLAGFALHHYRDELKPAFFRDCRNRLRPGGSLYLYDLFCRPGETREEYIQAYCENLERTWISLSPEKRGLSCDHIRNCDYPVPYATLAGYAQEAGFTCPPEPLYTDRFHSLYRFTWDSFR